MERTGVISTTPVFNNSSGATINVKHRNYTNDVANFNVGGPNSTWLTYGNDGFGLSRTGIYSGDSYKFFIYRIDRDGEVWGITFALLDEISEFCYATRIDENNNVIVLPTPAPPVVEETEEEQNVEETTGETEPSDAASEPAAEAATEVAEAAAEAAKTAVTEAATVPTEPSEPTSGEA